MCFSAPERASGRGAREERFSFCRVFGGGDTGKRRLINRQVRISPHTSMTSGTFLRELVVRGRSITCSSALYVIVQTPPLLIGEGDIGFHGSMGELGLPHARGEIDHVFRGMDAHALQHVNQVGVDIDAM